MNEDNEKKSIKYFFIKLFGWTAAIIIIAYLVFPSIFMLLGYACPDHFSIDGAINQLIQNINTLVGFCGLLVGIFSIYYAYNTNKRADLQQSKNEKFLQDLSDKVDLMSTTNTKIYDSIINSAQTNQKTDTSK